MRHVKYALFAAAAAVAMTAGFAQAQSEKFPAEGKQINIVVPWSAGGTADISMRLLLPYLEKELGVPVGVENIPGGGSQTGLVRCLNEPADGYTLCATSLPSTNLTYLRSNRNAPYSRDDFAPVATMLSEGGSIVVAKDSKYQTLADLVAAAKENRGEIRIGIGGRYVNAHIEALLFEKAAGVKLAPVFFDGAAPAFAALLGGHVDAVSSTPSNYISLYKSGDVRPLGIMAEQESQVLEGVPTMRSLGYDVVTYSTRTISARKGTDPERLAILEEAFRKVIALDEVGDKIVNQLGSDRYYLDGKDSEALWKNTDEVVGEILADE